MDFYRIRTKQLKSGATEVFPDFVVGRSKDLMIRGGHFYAIWDEENQVWSTDEYDVQRLVDQDLNRFAQQLQGEIVVKDLGSYHSTSWANFKRYAMSLSDNEHDLDMELTFANTEVGKTDYVSRRLPYALTPGDCPAWDELVGTLYSVEEREKIEWAIGSIVSGDSKKIQKFLVLYGPAGTGKSTILNIIAKLFDGYMTSFEAKALAGNNNSFATESFRNNPLVAIQHDGDLSKIEDNTKLNSIIAHEAMTFNEKYRPSYTARVHAFLFMGTNQPVRISDAKSGIIRRLIDVQPTGVKIPTNHYFTLMSKIDFELGAIASHCHEVYLRLGRNHYSGYRPLEMMLQTDIFFNFIEANFDLFKAQDGVSLKQAWGMYKEYCTETGIQYQLPQYKMRDELRNYFEDFHERTEVDGVVVRSWYSGFNANKFKVPTEEPNTFSLVIEETESLLDRELADEPAQYAKDDGTPASRWVSVRTTLSGIDTSRLHFVKVPDNHVVIDFDLKDINGSKSLERNLEAASTWPATYAELSRSGSGVHLHYRFLGSTADLSPVYSDGIEVKVYRGDASLRRLLTKCNAVPVADLAGGLPLKEKKMLDNATIKSERGLRDLIGRNLRKEIHPGTKPSVDFIGKILDEAYDAGISYDVTDLRPRILAFANNSTNQSLQALKVVQRMRFASEVLPTTDTKPEVVDDRITFFDVEVYPNLFVLCWKYRGSDTVVRMINPPAAEVEALINHKLAGFNNRRYDNHIVYAAAMGYTVPQLFELSQKLVVENNRNAPFGAAYNLSYCDIWDFSSVKKSLKKFEIDLGLHHLELDHPWDQPVPEEEWEKVVEYCVNDVNATEAVFEDRIGDFTARQILAELSGLSINDTTQRHTARIIFGEDRTPNKSFIYTDLSKEFPGYVFDRGKSSYRDEDPGEGGYVYAEPGMHDNVAVLDVASMHPTSIEVLNLFGKQYTKNFVDLKSARLAIKRGDYESARRMLDGRLAPFLGDESQAAALAYSLKIIINIVYGLTSAKFDNPFRDPRNVDNIVAKRGALFMIDLKHAVQEQGFTVAHIKTDSIKIPDATPEIIKFVMDFGQKYGYEFEDEGVYDKFVLVNDAVYVARKGDQWQAVGAQFQHPYVYKTLFTHEAIEFDDLCETKSVIQGVMYLDYEGDGKALALASGHMQHVGKTGRFVPVLTNGAVLYREKDGKFFAVTGTKDYRWIEAEVAKTIPDLEIDMSYFENLAEKAKDAIDFYGPFADLVR